MAQSRRTKAPTTAVPCVIDAVGARRWSGRRVGTVDGAAALRADGPPGADPLVGTWPAAGSATTGRASQPWWLAACTVAVIPRARLIIVREFR